MPEELCKRCGMQPVPECVNGHVLVDEYTARECPNFKRIRIDQLIRSRLPQQLYEAPVIRESALYTPGLKRGEPARINRTKDNLLIRGVTYNRFAPHLRLTFACLPLKFKIVDDSRIRDVFVGGEAYKSRPQSTRDQKEAFNVVADLIGEDFDLVVIRLGVLAYKNVAAPAVLREALMVRESLGKPTWLFEGRDVNWICSRDPELDHYIEGRFEEVVLADDGPEAEDNTDIQVDGEEEANGPFEHYSMIPTEAPSEDYVPPPTEQSSMDDDSLTSLLGGGEPKPKKWNRQKNWGKR